MDAFTFSFDELRSRKLLIIGFSFCRIGSVTFLQEVVTPRVRAQGHSLHVLLKAWTCYVG